MSTQWQVRVDRDVCMGTGACADIAPHVFAVGDDAVAMVIGPVYGSDETVRDAVAECPMAALRLIEGQRSDD
jgi:ferredoxin